jgi:hypothetical protein
MESPSWRISDVMEKLNPTQFEMQTNIKNTHPDLEKDK